MIDFVKIMFINLMNLRNGADGSVHHDDHDVSHLKFRFIWLHAVSPCRGLSYAIVCRPPSFRMGMKTTGNIYFCTCSKWQNRNMLVRFSLTVTEASDDIPLSIE